MHVMMISLDASLLGDPHGNTVQRHIEYAQRIGHVTVVAYNPADQPKSVSHLADNLNAFGLEKLEISESVGLRRFLHG